MATEALLRRVGMELRALAESTPTEADALPAWYARVREFEALVREDPELFDALPHFLNHYFADADVRVRDADYRAGQQAQVMEIIRALERGLLPKGAA